MKQFWNERYAMEEYIYGEQPNAFLKAFIDNNTEKGKILFTAEGEGRNAVYAAANGWTVSAFDYSDSAKQKAEHLAQKVGVSFTYDTLSVEAILQHYAAASFDVIAVVYNHFPPPMRIAFHKALPALLKKGGKIVMEVFNKQQLGNTSGGPQNEMMLYSVEMLRQDFDGLTFEMLEDASVELNEGRFHSGKAEVVRMIARKQE